MRSGIVRFDSLSIVPGSVRVSNADTSDYHLDVIQSVLTWRNKLTVDSVFIVYRVFPFRLNAETMRFNFDSIRKSTVFTPYVVEKPGKQASTTGLFDFGNVNYNGSFGRSLSFGNNQDAVFNSQLNLQMNGMIGDSVEISAAITDNNLPIQPDGTTSQLNEFDKILLQFRKKNWEVSLGDIDIRENHSYFLNFYKRLQGISYQQSSKVGSTGSNRLLVSGAIAKGKFTRNILQPLEGNQGPYRLQGANNEFFFIILAGTERVYIDGELMQRGEDQDYVINYNTAEVTFTPRRMITKDRRIQVEFEYADRNFLNSMMYGSNEIVANKKLKGFISVYNNADARNSPINQTVDVQQKQFLADLGDSVHLALYPVASIDTFSASKILYHKKDTTYGIVTETIYVYSTDPDSARYSLNFIEVGHGRGNYVPDFNGANGKVYKWVQPVGGVRQGNFEPAAFLVTPKKHRVVSGGLTYQAGERTTLSIETAISNYDANTFSSRQERDNTGVAGKFLLQREDKWKTTKRQIQLVSTAGYEFVQRRFRPVERLRPVEFGRDWGLGYTYAPADEHLPFISLALVDDRKNTLSYSFSSYLRSDQYRGFRHSFRQFNEAKGWQLRSALDLTNHRSPVDEGVFFRPSVELIKKMPRFRNHIIGAGYSVEHNEQRNKAFDTLNPASFHFDVLSAFIKSDPGKDNRWSFTYFTRRDQLPYREKLGKADQSDNYSFSVELLGNRRHQLRTTVTYRELRIKDQSLTKLTPDNSLLGRIEYMVNEWKGLLTGTILYELGAGQEQRRDYSFIEVPAGRGEYTWIDYNSDGIPQLSEFEIALFSDQARYIRIFTPTNEFIKANYTQFNYSFNLNPKAVASTIRNLKWKNLVTRVNLQSSMQAGKKVLSDGDPEFNPFKGNVADQSLITLNYILSNTLSFNRSSSAWGIDVTNITTYHKAILTYGFETRQLSDWIFKGRINVAKRYTFELLQKFSGNDLYTPKFANRNYELDIHTIEPRLIYTHLTRFRLQASYQYINKQNAALYGGERALSNVFTLDGKFNAVQRTSINGRFSFNNITYNGLSNTATGYIMLDGLLPGKNLLWMVDVTRRLANNLEISVQYEGRKPGETRSIHIGRASVRALL
ncbi:MAG: hypothetical protein K0Q66_1074 [Chitinophagaceae bacterium]|nr:hypothetical protein [Chitinophagaceae bacterium]